MRPSSLLLAFVAILGVAASATAACETVVYQTTCQPETRAWVSGHYEWVGDTWGYVPGHWVVTPARCQTTEIDRRGETVVYVERPTERVVYVDPPCEERRVVVVPACPPPVIVEDRRCEPRYRPPPRRSHVGIFAPVPVPIPVPLPFDLFRHHHH